MYEYKAKITKVVDGDTLIVDVDLGFNVWKNYVILRLNRIDAYETRLSKTTTPEMKKLGLAGKEWLIKTSDSCNQEVTIKTYGKGKYGRWIAEVYMDIDGQKTNINDALVSLGYALFKDY